MKRIACIFLIVTVLVSSVFFVKNESGTTVNGKLINDTRWTQIDSPVNLSGTVTISNNATLAIDPGVTVNLGIYTLYVNGTLAAIGEDNNEIIFTSSSNSNYTSNVFATILFSSYSTPWNSTDNSGSIIQNAKLNNVGLQINSASPRIDNCAINSQFPYQSLININDGSPVISNSVILYNNPGTSSNVNCMNIRGGTPLISNNRFEGQYSSSISNDIYIDSGSPTITGNTFDGEYLNSNSRGITINLGGSQITNNQFRGDGYLNGIYCSAGSTVLNNVFSNCYSGINAQDRSIMTVKGNTFLKGTDGISISTGASLTITNNLIDSNSRFGINGGGYIDSNTITNNQIGIHNPPEGTISNNNIVANTVNSITATTANINAQNNWWGTTDTQTINQTIYDQKIDKTLGIITFVPFLTQPSASAPAIPSLTPNITPIPTLPPTPQPTATKVVVTPPPIQHSESFVYQLGTIINLNLITTSTAAMLILVWIIIVLGYLTKRTVSKYKSNNKNPGENSKQ
jgi:parallel beta-helix repeat protein